MTEDDVSIYAESSSSDAYPKKDSWNKTQIKEHRKA
jgi:hypothetical protein